ncbi:MAG TPA: flagellar biosynthesis protein FlhB [Fimbriimonadaceae bacterium]|nr:flagellar biosynthesis protein FlhB [Fimbriimonadaceae bacterium]
MPDTSQERTEEATPKRRLEARRKGTVTKSTDLNNALVLLALILVLPAGISKIGFGFMSAMTTAFTKMPTELRIDTILPYVAVVIQPALIGLAIVIGAAMIVGLAANFAQVGFVLSGEALAPNLNKINPGAGLKRLFSMSATFEGFKASAKAGVFMYLAWTAIQSGWPQIVKLGEMTPTQSLVAIGLIVRAIAIRIAFVWLALAAIDYFFQRKQVDKQLRMTKEELKQEMKEQETSPELKMAQAARRRKLSRGRMMEAIKNADVVVTNPTHYAVAIKYDPGKSHAPIVVAKGADFLAAKIREVAGQHRVPIVPNPPLARALYKKCEIGDFVPRELFQAVAEVLAFVYRTIKKVKV